ncbi:hypothetical protein HHK36_010964 [Tetracentron sinense]|uniref:Integral membrane bound transporter domain-containing protein n=1 Tax=Tetracentron sinense TaxID=13715 RepID=A0A835DJG6_TETSI|nr:hypothetical protein HHK36_010964 [Tetracentron sinense]
MRMLTTADRTRAMWRSRLGSALRTTLACTIVGCTTLYGPAALRRQLAFPALSYVTVILIVTDATLGDTVRGCWHALYGTVQGVVPAMLSLWVIGGGAGRFRLSTTTTALAVGLSSFLVALPESTQLIARRIALGQIVLVYVIAYIQGVHTGAGVVMHPVHLAASTAVGAFASLLALLFPYPRLASYEVRQKCRLYGENASERLNLFVKAFCAEDYTSVIASISQAESLSKTATKLLQSIRLKQDSMQWEIPRIRFMQPHFIISGDRLQGLEIALRGMEYSLTSCLSIPVKMVDLELKDGLFRVSEQISLTLKQAKYRKPLSTVPETTEEDADNSLQTLQTTFPTPKDLPSFFFLFCLKLLKDESMITQSTESTLESQQIPKIGEQTNSHKQKRCTIKGILSSWPMRVSSERLMSAFKCSLSLGLAVLFGLAFSKENGYWSGLPVAISMAAGREATFKVANVKAQGTVLGSVYGILGCFIFQKFLDIRFLTLLPWILFSSFLCRSQMYGQAGGISAVIGALLILGRQNYGPPSEFAMARITETFIGLSCSIMVEIILQPTRASTLAKVQLSQSLGTLHDCINSIVPRAICLLPLKENQKKLKTNVSELAKFIEEAKVEPNFWFLPFHCACYTKLLGSLSKMVDLLLFGALAMGLLVQESQRLGVAWKELQAHLDRDMECFKKSILSPIKSFGEVTLLKSLAVLEKEIQNKNISYDLELGKSPNPNGLSADDDEMEEIISTFLQHSREVIHKIHAIEGEKELKGQMVLCLSAIGFCMVNLMRETREMEKRVKELVQWENPSSNINLYEISCKIKSLCT